MFVIVLLGIQVTGMAPFNLPPSAAFLKQIGLNIGPHPLLLHFGYGATWSMVLVALYGSETTVRRGLALAIGLSLFVMIVLSPIVAWGVFGFGGSGHTVAADSPLYLGSPVKYPAVTLVLHLIYGSIIGSLNPAWIQFGSSKRTTVQEATTRFWRRRYEACAFAASWSTFSTYASASAFRSRPPRLMYRTFP